MRQLRRKKSPYHHAYARRRQKANDRRCRRSPTPNTPLMMAARHGPEESVRLLVQRGANKRLQNDRNLTAADLARNGDRIYLLKMLD